MDFVALEKARLRAIVSSDSAALEELHSPDFVLCTPSGELWSRSFYLTGLRNGTISYSRFEPQSDIQVTSSNEVAVVRYLSNIDLLLKAGGGYLECWHLDVYVRDEIGMWRCRWSQATDTLSGDEPI